MKIYSPRVYGSEMEFGLHAEDEEGNPVTATSMDEVDPDAIGSVAQIVKSEATVFGALEKMGIIRASGQFGHLSNGARLYWDQGRNLEYATPELLTAEEVARYEVASERLVYDVLMQLVEAGAVARFWLYKRTTDHLGNSNGNHENTSTSLGAFSKEDINLIASHNATRGIYSGAGGPLAIGKEGELTYTLSPRLAVSGLVKSLSRVGKTKPLVNNRMARDVGCYRAHQVSGDANISPWAIRMRHAMNGVLFSVLEAEAIPEHLHLENPARVGYVASVDQEMEARFDASEWSGVFGAISWQRAFAEYAYDFLERTGEMTPDYRWALTELTAVCDDLERDPCNAADRVEWIRKKQFIEERTGKAVDAVADEDLLYQELAWTLIGGGFGEKYRSRGWGWAGFTKRPSADDLHKLNLQPPSNTRAHLRGEQIRQNPNHQVAWHTLGGDLEYTHPLAPHQTAIDEQV